MKVAGLLLPMLLSGILRAQQGSLEGTAIHAVTREPLSNVHVRLVAAAFGGVTAAYGAMSDRTGHFSIATIRPGTYILMPDRAGFLHVAAKGATAIPNITIKPGEHVTAYQLEMTPRAVISGRVVDEAGDPVQGVRVQTVPMTGGTPAVLMPAPNMPTDDRGEFRLTGPAGKYYVQATPIVPMGGNERPEIRTDGTSETLYTVTFYPSAVRKDRGAVVEAVAGKDVAGIEIRLARQQMGLSISGVVSGIPEGTWRGSVVLQSGENAQRVTGNRSTPPGADGKFRFDGLQPGYYRMWAMYNDGVKTQLASRTMEWQLENGEIANVEFVLTPGLEFSGTFQMEGETKGTAAPKRTVKLEPAQGYFLANLGMTGGQVDRDGAFRIEHIMPGRYRVRVEPLPENGYIKALEIDGMAVKSGIADLSRVARGASAKMTAGSNGAQISGRLQDAKGEPMPGSAVMIYLARDAEEIPQFGSGTAQATPEGKYTIKGVVPGKYHLFAIDAFQAFGSGLDPMESIKKLFERGEEVEFKEGDRITKDLKVLALEDPNATPKK